MNIEQELSNFGMTKTEIVIYLYLLEHGISSPPQIAKGTKIARTNSYHVLLSLKDRGLIEEQTKGTRKAYLAKDPQSLLQQMELRTQTLERMIPDLRALFSTQKNKPKISFFDGAEQIKQIYLSSLEAERIYAIGSTHNLQNLLPEFFKSYLKQVKQKKIIFKDILTSTSKSNEKEADITSSLYIAKYLPKEYQDTPVDILVWNDHVAIIALTEPVFGTVLTHKSIAEMMKMVVEILWKQL